MTANEGFTAVTQALLPVLARCIRWIGLTHRQECLCHPLPTAYCRLPTDLTPPSAWRNLEGVGAYRFRREPLRLGGMSGVHTTRNRSGTMTTANTQYAYAA